MTQASREVEQDTQDAIEPARKIHWNLTIAIDHEVRDRFGEEDCYDCGRNLIDGRCHYCATHAIDPGPLCACGKRLMRPADRACPHCDPSVRRATSVAAIEQLRKRG